jgi:hypothetical protein
VSRRSTASLQVEPVPAVRPAFAAIDNARALIGELQALRADEVGLAGDAPAIAYAVQALKRLVEMGEWRQRSRRSAV